MSTGDRSGRFRPISDPAFGPFSARGISATAALVLILGCVGPAPPESVRLYAVVPPGRGGDRAAAVVIPGIPPVTLSVKRASALAPLPLRSSDDRAERQDVSIEQSPSGVPAVDLIAALRLGGYRFGDPRIPGSAPGGPPNLFLFEYDWKRDLVESAVALHRFLLDRRAELSAAEAEGEGRRRGPIRFDLLADGAGGLLLRYFLRYGDAGLPEDGSLPSITWKGADLVDRAILIGTPNAGSTGALLDLLGERGSSNFLPGAPPPIVGTYPSFYQMLPRGRHGSVVRIQGGTREVIDDLFDPALWENLGWGLASDEADRALTRLLPREPDPVVRRRIALDHLRWSLRRARRFCETLDLPARPPRGLTLHLMASDNRPTDAVAGIDWSTGRVRVIERRPGDGAVLRSSALLDERVGAEWSPGLLSPVDWTSVMFFDVDGDRLTRAPAFIDNLLFRLLEQPRRSVD